MAKVRGTGNLSTEQRLADLLRTCGIKGWRRHLSLPGKPDFTFRALRMVVFVDGCFWHGCPQHCRRPVGNKAYWAAKIRSNTRRDRKTRLLLRANGWRVLRVWEHELRTVNIESLRRRLMRELGTVD